MISSNNRIDKEDFLSLYPSTHKWVFTSENICKGFIGVGLKSLDKEQVLLKITYIYHLKKAPQMSKKLLLQQEIKTLQAKNKQKTGKKARKRTTLSNDNILSIQEGQVCIQQLNEPTPMP